MYIHELRKALLRRWYLVLLGVAATIGLVFAVTRVVPPTYEAQSSVLLLPPASSIGDVGNPYLYLGGLNQAMDVLSQSLSSDESATAVADEFPGVSYTAGPDATTTGPIVQLIVQSGDPATTMRALQALQDLVAARLTTLQDDLSVATNSRISSMVLAEDQKPVAITKTRTRAMLAAGAVGLVSTVMLVGLLDRVLLNRARRKGGFEDTETDAATGGLSRLELDEFGAPMSDVDDDMRYTTDGHDEFGYDEGGFGYDTEDDADGYHDDGHTFADGYDRDTGMHETIDVEQYDASYDVEVLDSGHERYPGYQNGFYDPDPAAFPQEVAASKLVP